MNEFREWLSDNLRYIMLGVGVLLGLVVIFFGIRFITSAIDTNPNNTQIESEVTQTPTPTATPTPTPSVEVLVMESLIENGVPEITSLMQSYYNAIASNDIETLRTLVDNLTLEDEATIIADTVTAYSDIRVFTKITNIPGVYIVFVSYKYQLSGINTAVPGLTQLCVHTANDGSLYVSTAGPNAVLQAEIDQIIRSTEAQNLIENIQTQYEMALDSDPALYAYFHGTQAPAGNTQNNNTNNNTSGLNNGANTSGNTTSGNNNTGSNTSGNNNTGNNNTGNNRPGNTTSGNNNTGNNNTGNNRPGNTTSGNNNTGNNNTGNNNTGNNTSGNNTSGNNNSNNSGNDSNVTPEPTWAPGSRPTIDTDGGVIPTPEPPSEFKLELKERAKLYEKADTGSNVIRTWPASTQMVKIGESGDFYEVDIHGEVGYILKSCFK